MSRPASRLGSDAAKPEHGLAFREVQDLLGRHDLVPSYAHSFASLVLDLVINVGFFLLSRALVSGGYVSPTLFWPFYAYVQGTLLVGPWVLAHECGHGAFSPSKSVNDTVGYILHTFLLVPYFSWQHTHSKHHKYTNHLTKGESHVPMTREDFSFFGWDVVCQLIGEDAFSLFYSAGSLVFGWPIYLFFNITGGRVKADTVTPLDGNFLTRSHFAAGQIFPARREFHVYLSTAGLVLFIAAMLHLFGASALAYWYAGPYLVSNAWLVLYTYLQHTSPEVPHYNTEGYTHFMGAVSTVDRRYNAVTNFLHHHIGDSHVLHHINSRIPFYKATELTPKVADILTRHGLYNYDARPAFVALIETARRCHFVESTEGVQYYRSWSGRGERTKRCASTPDAQGQALGG